MFSDDPLLPTDLASLPPLPPSPNPHGRFINDQSEHLDLDDSIELGRSNLQRSNSYNRGTATSGGSSPTQYPLTAGRRLTSPRKQTSPDRTSPDKPSHVNTVEPHLHPFAPTPARSSNLLAPPVTQHPGNRSASASSCYMPRSALDMSMLGECAPPSEMDQTMDLGYDESGRVSMGPGAPSSERREAGVRHRGKPEDFGPEEVLGSPHGEFLRRDNLGSHSKTLPRNTSYPSASLPSSNLRDQIMPKFQTPIPRPFPASSSGSSLSSTGGDTARGIVGDVSTVLPISARKTRHLLRDEHLLKKETLMFEDESMLHSRPGTMRSPFAIRQGRPPMPRMEEDMTMDIGALMAQMKGKPAGVEESFVDLLHGDDGFDGLNQAMLGGDESFLPASLRPMWGRNGTMPSPQRSESRAPTTPSAFGLQHRTDMQPTTLSRSARRRSRSLHEARSQVDALASVRRRLESTSGTTPGRQRDPITPSVPRARLGMAPTASKRVSLSAGAVPMPVNASHKKMELPTRTPRNDPVSLARTRSIERRPGPIAGDGSPVLPLERQLESKRGLSTPARLLTKRSLPRAGATGQNESRGGPGAEPRARTYSRPRSGTEALATPGAHKRTGSTPAAAVAAARTATTAAPTSRTLSRPMVRASASATSLANPRTLPRSSSRPGLTSGLHSATSSREFGKDASGATNRERISRPPTSSLTSKRSIGSKLSTDPASLVSPTKRADPAALKSRAMSTPASTVLKARPISHVSSRVPASSGADVPKRSLAPPNSVRDRASATTSALSRSGMTRVPAPVKSSIGAGSGGLDDLRARLNKLSIRQQTSRAAK